MCGIVAVIAKKDITEELKRRNYADLKTLLLYNVDRGKDATGIFGAGTKLVKDSINAYEFFKKYHKELKDIPSHIMLAHTRNSSVNHIKDAANAHPINIGSINLVHNGTLRNWIDLRKLYEFDYKEVDMDSKLIAYALNKTKNFEVLEKYDGTANLVWHHDSYPDCIFVYKDPDKELFYGRKEGTMFISSIMNSLIAIDIDEKDIYTFHENTVSKIEGDKIENQWNIKRDPYKTVYVNEYYNSNKGFWEDGKKFDDWSDVLDYRRTKEKERLSKSIEAHVNYDAFEPTSIVSGNMYEWDNEINQFIRKDIYKQFHNCKPGTNIVFHKKNAHFFEGSVKKEYTGISVTKNKNITTRGYYLNGKLGTLVEYENAYKEAIDKATDKWFELQEKNKEVVQAKNAGCLVPRKWGNGDAYWVNGHIYSGYYQGLLEGKTMEELNEEVLKLTDEYDDMLADKRVSDDVANKKKSQLDSAREMIKVYEHKLRKHKEDPSIIGKYFLHGFITTKEVYEHSEKRNAAQTTIELPEASSQGQEEISDDKLVNDEDITNQEKLEEIAEVEQELLDKFAELAKELAEIPRMYTDIDTKMTREVKAVSKVIGESLLEIIENSVLTRKNSAGEEFTTPEILLPVA